MKKKIIIRIRIRIPLPEIAGFYQENVMVESILAKLKTKESIAI